LLEVAIVKPTEKTFVAVGGNGGGIILLNTNWNKNMKKYKIIYADPAWFYPNCKKRMKYGGAVIDKYPTLKMKDIEKLPIQNICADASILFLWATFPRLKEALKVIEAWGFKYRTIGFIWIKTLKNGKIDDTGKGMGFFTKENAEICLLATRYVNKGRNQIKRIKGNISSIIIAPRGKHSEKPAIVRNKIVELLGDLPRIELFARQKTKGWDVWGNEVKSDIELL